MEEMYGRPTVTIAFNLLVVVLNYYAPKICQFLNVPSNFSVTLSGIIAVILSLFASNLDSNHEFDVL